MEHSLPLISTIAVGLGLAFLCGFAASKLRISPIVGYLFAGVIVGPFTPGFVANTELASELSEIGIVLLMFGVGLHFSLKDLIEVKKIAVTGAILRIFVVTALGALLGLFWGWEPESSVLFGLALSVASTVVLLRAMEEQNLQNSTEGRIAIGWLIVEDLIMILALVLVPVLASGADEARNMSALWSLAIAIGKVALFVAVMEVGGRRILPWVLTAVSRTGSRELFTLAVIAVAISVAFGASHLFGVSLALGAFFAGVVIRESDLNHKVADRVLPFQDAFAVLFFVAVGMLFNPVILLEKPLSVLAVAGVIIAVKFAVTFFIMASFRYPLRKNLIVSAGLSQIGEFSFVLVSLGLSYNILPVEGRDLLLAGALASIALNPVVFYFCRRFLMSRRARLADQFTPSDDLAHLSGGEKSALRDIVILVGYGRLGRQILQDIHEAHIDLVVVDSNRERIEGLREKGYHAIAGDAGHRDTLIEAAVHKAVAIVVAVPDPYEARQIVETARSLKPSIKILVRVMNDEELEYFEQQGVDLALMGLREIGKGMVRYLHDMRAEAA